MLAAPCHACCARTQVEARRWRSSGHGVSRNGQGCAGDGWDLGAVGRLVVTWSAGGVWQLGCSSPVPQHCCTAPKSEAGIVRHTRMAPVLPAPAPWARCAAPGHPVRAAQGSHTGLGVPGRGARGVGPASGFLSLLEAQGLPGVSLEQPQAHGRWGPAHGFACAERAPAPVLRPGGSGC